MRRALAVMAMGIAFFGSGTSGEPLYAAQELSVEVTPIDVWQSVATHEHGESREALSEVEKKVQAALKGGKGRKSVIRGLLGVISSEQSTVAGRSFACRQLARIGSKESVPALTTLLAHEELSHMARYALQRIPHEAAGTALRGALGELGGELRIGIINSLGERRDIASVPLVSEILASADRETAVAVLEMLGKVGDESAAEILIALETVRGRGETKVPTNVLADALLRCGDLMAAEGEVQTATRIYTLVAAEVHTTHVRIAGLRGLAFLRPVETAPMLANLLASEDPLWRDTAAKLIAEVGGMATTEAYAELLLDTSGELQLRLLGAIAERGDPTASPVVMSLLVSGNAELAGAAIVALGSVGDPSCVSSLALLASAGSEEARASLCSNRSAGFDRAIGETLHSEPVAEVRVELALALGVRRATAQVKPLLFAAADDKLRDVRVAALSSLCLVAGEKQLPMLVPIAREVDNSAEAAAVIDAVVAAIGRSENREASTAHVIAGLEGAKEAGRVTLLRILGEVGGNAALVAVRDTLSAPGEVGMAACEALAGWPDAGAAEELLEIARGALKPDAREAAFSGFVHTASMKVTRSPEVSVRLFGNALELAKSGEMQREALEGIALLEHPDALMLAERYLESEETRRVAALAMISIANTIVNGHTDDARHAVEQAMKACPKDREVVERAGAVINRLEKNADYITAWRFSGPYSEKDVNGTAIFDVAFPPEPGGPEGKAKVREIPKKAIVAPGFVDFQKFVPASNACCYLETRIIAMVATEARLEIGSDDGVIVWLNGEVVHKNNAMRGMSLGSDVVSVELRKGKNSLVLKVTQGGGDWRAACRIRSVDGHHLEGVQVTVP